VNGDSCLKPRFFDSGLGTPKQALRFYVRELVSSDNGNISRNFDPSIREKGVLDLLVQVRE